MTFPCPNISPYKPPLKLTKVHTAYDGTNTGSFSFPSCNFGPASADRIIVGLISYRRNTALGISGVTIGGVSATVVAGSATSLSDTYIFWAAVPTGTSGTVAMTMNSAGASLVLYSITGQTSNTPVFTNYVTSGTPLTSTQTIGAKAVVLASFVGGNTPAATWGGSAGIVQDYNLNPAASTSDMLHTTATLLTTTALGSATITCTNSGGQRMAVAIWQ